MFDTTPQLDCVGGILHAMAGPLLECEEVYAQARLESDKALSLAPDLAVVHVARRILFTLADLDWTGAESAYRHAMQRAPSDGYAQKSLGDVLAILGQTRQAVELVQKALVTEPLNSIWQAWLGTYLSALGYLDEAEAATRKAIELQPTAVSYYMQLSVIAIQRGDAMAALDAARREPPRDWQDIALALAQQASGDRAAADAALKKLIDTQSEGSAYQIAEVHALRRDADKAFECMVRALANRDPWALNLLFDPIILRYPGDPRFAAYCKKVGLPTTTDAKALP